MKTCAYCGRQNPDEVTHCEECATAFAAASPPPSLSPPPLPELLTDQDIAHEEQRFWERMTFKDFAILWLRLQALWFLVSAIEAAFALPTYFQQIYAAGSFFATYPGFKLHFLIAVLRVLLYFAAALAVIQFAEQIVSWFVRNWITRQRASEI